MPTFVGASSNGLAAAGSFTVPLPAGAAEGHRLIAIMMANRFGTTTDLTAPAGFEVVSNAPETWGSTAGKARFFTKVVGASEPTSYTFSNPDNSHWEVLLLAFSDAGAPTEFAWSGDPNDVTAQVAPSVAGAAGSTLVCAWLAGGTSWQANITYTPPANMVERVDFSGNYAVAGAVATQDLAADGATGTRTATRAAALSYISLSMVLPADTPAEPLPTLTDTQSQTQITTASGTVAHRFEVLTHPTTANSQALVYLPESQVDATSVRLILAQHALHGSRSFMEDSARRAVLDGLLDAGYVVVAPEYGNSWGNPDAQSRMARAYDYINAQYPAEGVGLFAWSMGGAASSIAAHRATVPGIRAVGVVAPILDLQRMEASGDSTWNAAWGTTDHTIYDPVTVNPALFAGQRWRITSSPEDNFSDIRNGDIPKFEARVPPYLASYTHETTTGEHGSTTQTGDPAAFVALFDEAFANDPPGVTLAFEGNTALNDVASPLQVPGISVRAGDILVITAVAAEAYTTFPNPPTGGNGFTWTKRTEGGTEGGTSRVCIWTATATADQTFTLSMDKSGANIWGFFVKAWRGAAGVGTAATADSTSTAQGGLTLTTLADGSVIDLTQTDWNVTSNLTWFWHETDAGAPVLDFAPSSQVGYSLASAHHLDAGPAGPKVVGASAPFMRYTISAVEILPAGSVVPMSGTASGSWGFAGSVSGKSTRRGAAGGSWGFLGATGGRTARSGAATPGSWGFTGSAEGKTPRSGAASGSWGFAGSASGTTTRSGAATSAWGFAGEASGAAPTIGAKTGTTSGSWGFAGDAAGKTSRSGAASGAWGFAGTAAGAAPAIDGKSGLTWGSWGFAGLASGTTTRSGAATGAWGFTGAANGQTTRQGSAAGSWGFAGAAVGISPERGALDSLSRLPVEGHFTSDGTGVAEFATDGAIPTAFVLADAGGTAEFTSNGEGAGIFVDGGVASGAFDNDGTGSAAFATDGIGVGSFA